MDKLQIFHFIGIGGVSMSALAILLRNKGFECQGSDITESNITKQLMESGISVNIPHSKYVVDKADVIIISSAIGEENEELKRAKELKKPVLTRGELLGKLSKEFKTVIAVAGSHGKTTTTGMLAQIFEEAGLFPTVHIGGVLKKYNRNYILGSNDLFITEACEYKDNFLNLNPSFSVVTSFESEHLDFFKNINNLKSSFNKFLDNSGDYITPKELSEDGLVLGEDFQAINVKKNDGRYSFTCLKKGKAHCKVKLGVYGEFNINNALCAIAAADYFKVDKKIIASALKNFTGVKRRFEIAKFHNHSKLIFDYAHHPTEILNSIITARSITKGKLVVLFQPHTYSRTVSFFDDFINSLSKADELILFKTYPAREEPLLGGSAYDLYEKLKYLLPTNYTDDYNILSHIKKDISIGDSVLVLGAGDFYDKCKR